MFVRKKDQRTVQPLTKLEAAILPSVIDKSLGESIEAAAVATGNFGKGTLVIVAILSFFGYNIVAQLLGQVRSLALITHFMMMQLVVP